MRKLNPSDVLNRDVQNPPTEETLTAMVYQARLASRFIMGYWVLTCVLLAAAWATPSMALLVPTGLMVGLSMLIPFIHEPAFYYEPIPKAACQVALNCFSATAAGVEYLNKLRDMGREVTRFDVYAARSLAELENANEPTEAVIAKREAACRKLYGIETERNRECA